MPDTNTGGSRPRIWLVKDRVGVKRKVQRKPSLLRETGGAGSFKNKYRKWPLASPYFPPLTPSVLMAEVVRDLHATGRGDNGVSKVIIMWWKKHSAGDREGWVLVAA